MKRPEKTLTGVKKTFIATAFPWYHPSQLGHTPHKPSCVIGTREIERHTTVRVVLGGIKSNSLYQLPFQLKTKLCFVTLKTVHKSDLITVNYFPVYPIS